MESYYKVIHCAVQECEPAKQATEKSLGWSEAKRRLRKHQERPVCEAGDRVTEPRPVGSGIKIQFSNEVPD